MSEELITEVSVAFPDPVIDVVEVSAANTLIDVIELSAPDTVIETVDVGTTGGGGTWGSITGTLSDQTDLQAALDAAGGHFLAENTARVDPLGDDSTGTIGDLGKPFLTAQAAFTAFEDLAIDESLVVILGNFDAGPVTTSLSETYVIGLGLGTDSGLGDVTLTATGGTSICFWNAGIGDITVASSCSIALYGASAGNVVVTGGTTIYSDAAPGGVGNVTASGGISLHNLVYVGTLSAPGQNITIDACLPINPFTLYYGAATIDSAGSSVAVSRSIIQTVTAAGTLTLVDSRVVGTNNASSTVYADVILAGDDTAYDATSWNGDTRTPSKNAVRDKFESLTSDGVSIGLAVGLAIALG